MRQISCHWGLSWVLALGVALPQTAQDAGLIRASDVLPCLDDMETVPAGDESQPILIAADGVCLATQAPISI